MAQDDDGKLCPLCAEDLTPLSPGSPLFPIQRDCCGQATCQSCLYRHLRSIFEVTGNHRPLLCPAGCGAPVTDTQVRACLQRQHASRVWKLIGTILYYLSFGWIVRATLIGTILHCLSFGWIVRATCTHYACWWEWLHTREERRDLLRYEAWSKQMAYVAMAKKNDDVVLHCPAPDCDFSWVVANVAHRRQKQAQEAQDEEPRSSSWWPWSTTSRLEEIPDNWVESDHYKPVFPRAWTDGLWDGRRMDCGKCSYVFCGLCRYPWQHGRHGHHGCSCVEYHRQFPTGMDAEAVFTNARPCPGCRQYTNRISGCNQMTCPCGTYWCYGCGERWSGLRHYGCADLFPPATTTNNRQTNAAPAVDPCVIL